MLQNFPCYAQIMPGYVPLCSKYAYIKLRLDCSDRVSNEHSIEIFQHAVAILLEYINL